MINMCFLPITGSGHLGSSVIGGGRITTGPSSSTGGVRKGEGDEKTRNESTGDMDRSR